MTVLNVIKSFFIDMTKAKQRHQAIELFKQGHGATYISKQLGVSLRTVQRWVKSYNSALDKDLADSLPQSPSVQQLEPPIQQVVPEITENTQKPCMGLLEEIGEEKTAQAKLWGKAVSETLYHHMQIHSEVAELMLSKLRGELNNPDSSPRTLNHLSLAVCRHLDYQQKNLLGGRQTMLELGRARATCYLYDLVVIDKKYLNEAMANEND